MCCFKRALCYIILYNFVSLVSSQEYLYDVGTILYRNHNNLKKKFPLETTNVKYIDGHLVPDAIAIKVTSTIIPHLYEGAIRNMPQLKHCSLPDCKIREISPGAFKNLPKLRNLHLQDNELEIIDEGVFNYLNVENLYLQRNRINVIRPGAFDNMPLLKKIHLNSNMLTKWDSQWFKNTPNLMFLHFRRNQISELPESAFVHLRMSHRSDGLKNTAIYLSKNRISYIHPRAFANVHNLRELCLDRNKIEKIDKDVFAHFTEIKRLKLHKNKITEIDKYAFRELSSMAQLNLAFNRNLNCIEYEVVENVNIVNIEEDDIYCSCLMNLREKLEENGLSPQVKIIYNRCLNETSEE